MLVYYGAALAFIYVLTFVLSPEGLVHSAVRSENLSLIRFRARSPKSIRADAVVLIISLFN